MTADPNLRDHPSSLFRPARVVVPVVERHRLLAQMMGPDVPKLTSVTAPVGYGKTVLLTQLFDSLRKQSRPCVWLSLGHHARNVDLLELLWAAADHAALPSFGHTITVHGLINRLESCADLCLILDGLDISALRSSDRILSRLICDAPCGIRFVIAADTALPLPLVRLEASGQLHQIDAGQLALREADLVALGRLVSLPAWITSFNAEVEGWPAIVQLALRRSSRERYTGMPSITGRQQDMAAFFGSEVLRFVHGVELERLLDTSVVDRVCGSLLDALTGATDGARVLNQLIDLGIPITASPSRDWFRLHPLLRQYLYEQLQQHHADRLTLLHQRAADWLLACDDNEAALRHATASGNIGFLRSLYQGLDATQIIMRDKPVGLFATRDPKWKALFEFIESERINAARRRLAAIRRENPACVDADLQDIRAEDWESTFADLLVRVFDDRLPRPEHLESLRDRLMRTRGVLPAIPAAVSELVVVSRFRCGDFSGVDAADHNLWHTNALAPTQAKIYALMELGIAALELGQLETAGRHLKNAEMRAVEVYGSDGSQAQAARTLLTEVAFERGDQPATAEAAGQSLAMMEHEAVWFNFAASAYTTISAAAAHRSWSEALGILDVPRSVSDHVGLWRLPPLLVAQRLRLALIWGQDLHAARRDREVLRQLGLLDLGELDGAGFGWRVSVPAQLAVIRFDLADGNAEAAMARSVALRPILEARRQVRRLIELDLLQGRAAICVGYHAAGHALIRMALAASAATGMIRSFLDEARFLAPFIGELRLAKDLSAKECALLDHLAVKPVRPLSRPTRYVADGKIFELSSREAQLLRAMATGKTFKEISFMFDISINTINMHRTRLYKKLGCNSRSRAMALANQFMTG